MWILSRLTHRNRDSLVVPIKRLSPARELSRSRNRTKAAFQAAKARVPNWALTTFVSRARLSEVTMQ